MRVWRVRSGARPRLFDRTPSAQAKGLFLAHAETLTMSPLPASALSAAEFDSWRRLLGLSPEDVAELFPADGTHDALSGRAVQRMIAGQKPVLPAMAERLARLEEQMRILSDRLVAKVDEARHGDGEVRLVRLKTAEEMRERFGDDPAGLMPFGAYSMAVTCVR